MRPADASRPAVPAAHRDFDRHSAPPRVVVIMGVAGSGKTTVGELLARELHWSFRDADEFHPAENIAKMAAGVPLNDEDRAPWLAAIAAYVRSSLERNEPAVVTCSALKERYREAIVVDPARVRLVHLTGEFSLILERLRQRPGHFMKPAMLQSQFEALEMPADVLQLDVARTPTELVQAIRRSFGL